MVFWTRNPKPLFPYFDELDQRGYLYYFQYTLLGYPREIDTKSPSRQAAIKTFQELADRIGPQRMIWRYDPIVLSQLTGAQYHAENYAYIAEALQGYTHRSVVSVMDVYKKLRNRIDRLNQQGVGVIDHDGQPSLCYDALMSTIAQIAHANDMESVSCAEERELESYGILSGKCIDDAYIEAAFGIGIEVSHKKDPSQRKACGCVVSKDIGMYDTCVFGCQYCYATTNFERSKVNFEAHDPASPSLLGWYEPIEEKT